MAATTNEAKQAQKQREREHKQAYQAKAKEFKASVKDLDVEALEKLRGEIDPNDDQVQVHQAKVNMNNKQYLQLLIEMKRLDKSASQLFIDLLHK